MTKEDRNAVPPEAVPVENAAQGGADAAREAIATASESRRERARRPGKGGGKAGRPKGSGSHGPTKDEIIAQLEQVTEERDRLREQADAETAAAAQAQLATMLRELLRELFNRQARLRGEAWRITDAELDTLVQVWVPASAPYFDRYSKQAPMAAALLVTLSMVQSKAHLASGDDAAPDPAPSDWERDTPPSEPGVRAADGQGPAAVVRTDA